MERNGDWAERLPGDILDCIIGKIKIYVDFVRFGAVCRTWRRATQAPHNREGRIEYKLDSYRHGKVPVLIFPHPLTNRTELEKEEWVRSIYSVTHRRIVCEHLTFMAPDAGARCFGSSHGWLITVSLNKDDPYNLVSIRLVNPFYITQGGGKRGGVITLPPLTPYPNEPRRDKTMRENMGVRKVELSANPADSPNDYLVAVLLDSRDYPELALFKSGDDHWKYVKRYYHNYNPFDGFSAGCGDMIFYKGCLYLISVDGGGLVVCSNPTTPNIISQNLAPNPIRPPFRWPYRTTYYVVNCDAYILLVCRVYDDSLGDHYKTKEFNLFRLRKLKRLGWKWLKVNDIEDKAIFVGNSYSTCVDLGAPGGVDQGELQPNSIYFTDDFVYPTINRASEPCSWDMGIYNLKDGSFHHHYQLPTTTHPIPSPVWFIPF